MDLTEQVYEAAGISPGDRTLRGGPGLDRDLLKGISLRERKHHVSPGALTVDGVLSTVGSGSPGFDPRARRSMLVGRGAMPHTPQASWEEGRSVLRAVGG